MSRFFLSTYGLAGLFSTYFRNLEHSTLFGLLSKKSVHLIENLAHLMSGYSNYGKRSVSLFGCPQNLLKNCLLIFLQLVLRVLAYGMDCMILPNLEKET